VLNSIELETGYRGYVAGVLDCDGAIWINALKSNNVTRFQLRIAVSNTRPGLLDFFSEKFGGRVGKSKKKNTKWKTEYRWGRSGLPAAEVVSLCLPYLVIKREQAMLALEFASTIIPDNNRIPVSYHEIRERIYHQMLELNKRGTE